MRLELEVGEDETEIGLGLGTQAWTRNYNKQVRRSVKCANDWRKETEVNMKQERMKFEEEL